MRAKKIKNKPIVNEVLSEAVISKRMKKQIENLEEQLANERKKLKETERKILDRKKQIIQHNNGEKPEKNRRRTWAPTLDSQQVETAKAKKSLNRNLDLNTIAGDTDNEHTDFQEFGHQVLYSDEQFNNIMDCSFGACSITAPKAENRFLVRITDRLNPPKYTSLLKTPRSLKNVTSRISRPIDSPTIPKPIDKDQRIQDLEDELMELQQFQQMELWTNTPNSM